jgi:two-component system, NarL family, nitrate/nitrite response regulator NarL
MNIILCSKNDFILGRWQSILAVQQFPVHPVSSPHMLEEALRGQENYLLMVHQSFADQQVIGRLCGTVPHARVFILSDTPNTIDGILLLKMGVIGYANTYISPARLREAVKIISSGRVWFDHEIISLLIQSINPGNSTGAGNYLNESLEPLTQREREIAVLVAEGLTNHTIAEKLFITERTVKSHLGSIFQKTGVASRVKLALLIHNHR